jgi:hypothetical protein
MLRVGILLVILSSLAWPWSVAAAEKRVALVIGNAAYKYAGELANPRNDADDFAIVLKALGVEVLKGVDLNKRGMEQEIRRFSAALADSAVGIFFYSGHGLQVNGNNYLVPVDAELSTADALEFEMVRLDLVQRIMEGNAKTNVLFLDACRNNPLARNLARALGTRSAGIGRGLAPAESGVGTLISFSTQPGNVALDGKGRNSPFTGSLVRQIQDSKEDLNAILIAVRRDVRIATQNTQVPWEHSALLDKFWFRDMPTPSKADQPIQVQDLAAQRWQLIKEGDDPEVFEMFRKQFGATDPLLDRLAASRIEHLKRLEKQKLLEEEQRKAAQAKEEVAERRRRAAEEAEEERKRVAAIETARTSGVRFWNHNGSTMKLVTDGARREFYYENPREGMREEGVTSGTLLFEGSRNGNSYSGTAYVFLRGCGRRGYRVNGSVSNDDRIVKMYGQAPRLDAGCKLIGYRADELVFELIGQ